MYEGRDGGQHSAISTQPSARMLLSRHGILPGAEVVQGLNAEC